MRNWLPHCHRFLTPRGCQRLSGPSQVLHISSGLVATSNCLYLMRRRANRQTRRPGSGIPPAAGEALPTVASCKPGRCLNDPVFGWIASSPPGSLSARRRPRLSGVSAKIGGLPHAPHMGLERSPGLDPGLPGCASPGASLARCAYWRPRESDPARGDVSPPASLTAARDRGEWTRTTLLGQRELSPRAAPEKSALRPAYPGPRCAPRPALLGRGYEVLSGRDSWPVGCR